MATNISCSSPGTAGRYIDLGVKCGDSFVSLDYFFECGKDNEYDTRPNDYRFTCFSKLDVPPESTGVPMEIPTVEAYTDYRYVFLAGDNCYSYFPPPVTASRTAVSDAMKDISKANEAWGSDATSTSQNLQSGSDHPVSFGVFIYLVGGFVSALI